MLIFFIEKLFSKKTHLSEQPTKEKEKSSYSQANYPFHVAVKII